MLADGGLVIIDFQVNGKLISADEFVTNDVL